MRSKDLKNDLNLMYANRPRNLDFSVTCKHNGSQDANGYTCTCTHTFWSSTTVKHLYVMRLRTPKITLLQWNSYQTKTVELFNGWKFTKSINRLRTANQNRKSKCGVCVRLFNNLEPRRRLKLKFKFLSESDAKNVSLNVSLEVWM